MEIVKRCKNLSSLNLCLNWIINDRCVEVIAKEGQNLKELYLVSCKITDYALIAIGRYSMTIETVDVGWCKEITDQGATLIAQSSKSLRYLGLMRCDKVRLDMIFFLSPYIYVCTHTHTHTHTHKHTHFYSYAL
uniref:F-box and leucine rich repeat protein 17 n=1 Tax=Sus scrofa TaxID=9823 RepID=A0A8D0U2Q6_PIG